MGTIYSSFFNYGNVEGQEQNNAQYVPESSQQNENQNQQNESSLSQEQQVQEKQQPVQEDQQPVQDQQQQQIEDHSQNQNQEQEWEDAEDQDQDEEDDDDEDEDEVNEDTENQNKSSEDEEVKEQNQVKGSTMEFGCQHYRRACEKKCPQCLEFFTCRFCHDDVKYMGERDPKKIHQIDRYAVQEIRCLKCKKVQPVQQNCEECKIEFAKHFCAVCKFFDDDVEKKKIFHCDKCNICRVGGRENFFHCDQCECCLALSLRGTHACKNAAMKNNCPVCLDDMHSSTKSSHFLRCGHMMHTSCFSRYFMTSMMCPTCRKSLVDPAQMEASWDLQVSQMPMPDEYKNMKMTILCNDCNSRSEVPFHILGGKCQQCRSINTSREGLQE